MRRLLRREESTEGRHSDRLLDFGRIQIDERTARAVARIVDDDIRRAELALYCGEQLLDVGWFRRIARERLRTSLLRETFELSSRARRKRDLQSIFAEQPRERGAQPTSRANDQSGSVIRHRAAPGHRASMEPGWPNSKKPGNWGRASRIFSLCADQAA